MTEFGINKGSGICPLCKCFMNLKITPDIAGEEMEAAEWNKYTTQVKA
jgi:hypothetical protein